MAMVGFWNQRSRRHQLAASRCALRTAPRPFCSLARKYSLRSMPADQAGPAPVSTSTPKSSRNSISSRISSMRRLSSGDMALRLSGRLKLSQAIRSAIRRVATSEFLSVTGQHPDNQCAFLALPGGDGKRLLRLVGFLREFAAGHGLRAGVQRPLLPVTDHSLASCRFTMRHRGPSSA